MKHHFKISIDSLSSISEIHKMKDDRLLYCDEKKTIDEKIYNAVNGELEANSLLENLFPQNCFPHIFISHSHEDEKLIIKFANFMYMKHGIRCFIDSMFWSHIKDSLKVLNDIYCINNKNLHDCEKSNKILAHMHILLNTSLMEVMHSSDCVFFVESGNSVLASKDETYSPWIFSEISVANHLKENRHVEVYEFIKSLEEKYGELGLENYSYEICNEEKSRLPNIRYNLTLENFPIISADIIRSIKNNNDPVSFLIELYRVMRVNDYMLDLVSNFSLLPSSNS